VDKPLSPKDAQGSSGTGGALPSPTCDASGHNPAGASSGLETVESPKTSPPCTQSYGLGSASGHETGEGPFMPQSEKPLQQHSRVAESLWDNPEFIRAGFHIERFIMAAVDIEAGRENIKALYANLKSTSAQIDVST
jgi:hypothetical protein